MTHPIDPAAHGLNRRHCLAGLAALALQPLSAAAAHAAQAYPCLLYTSPSPRD